MNQTSPDPSALHPRLAFRVGVTGARNLDAANTGVLRDRVRQVLAAVRDRVVDMARDPACQAIYKGSDPGPLLHLLSPLAEGADRLVAEEALALGYQLSVPMPFSAAEYTADFPATVPAFRALLARAGTRVLELDGGRGDNETRSYEAVGRLVVRNCDLVIAIFDGGPGKGRGGTAEIARFASHFGPPVWWLRADGLGKPAWITDPRGLLHPHLAVAGDAAWAALDDYLRRSIMPPLPPAHGPHMLIGRLARRLRVPPRDPLAIFLAETPRPARFVWTLHKRTIAWAAGLTSPQPAAVKSLQEPADSFWGPLYRHADRAAVDYANRYRSSYVIVFGLAALALICAVVGVLAHAWALAACELALLLGIAAVVAVNEDRHWQDRLIAYRLLAELCRKQAVLAPLGWSLPMAEATRVVSSGVGQAAHEEQALAWAGWYFNALRRAAPLQYGTFDAEQLRAARDSLVGTLVAGQAEYHDARKRSHYAAARFFGRGGEALFLITVGVVVIEVPILLSRHGHGWSAVALGLAAAVLPALSAALVGIRSYAELEMVAEQSSRMRGIMGRAAERLAEQPLNVPLVSQELGAETFWLADEMMRDLTGWMQLFSVKAIEAG